MIFITGSTGFVGSHLLFALKKGNTGIRAMKRKGSSLKQLKAAYDYYFSGGGVAVSFEEYMSGIEWVECDLLDQQGLVRNLQGVDEIYHAAACIAHDKKMKKTINDVNIRGTTNLVNLALAAGIEKFHYISSIAALDRNEEDIITEIANGKREDFSSDYSKSKYLAELEVWRGYEEGLKGVIVNPGLIIGPGDPSSGSLGIFSLVKKGFSFYPAGSSGYVDVRDVAGCLVKLAADEKFYKQRYLLVSETMSYKDIFEKIANCFNVKAPSHKALKNMAYLLAFVDGIWSAISGKEQKITTELVTVSSRNYFFDNQKIREALGYEFIALDRTIRETCEFMMLNNMDKS